MSLVNFQVKSDRILVAVDSIGGTSKLHQHVNKLFPVPHARMLLCGRGNMAFIAKVFNACSLLSCFDEAREVLPRELPKILQEVRTEVMVYYVLSLGRLERPKLSVQEIYVFGWSDRLGEMSAMRFAKQQEARDFVLEEDLAGGVAPWLGRGFPVLDSTEAMMRLAAEQVGSAMRDDQSIPIGGRLMLAELTRDGIMLRCAGEINPDLTHKNRGRPGPKAFGMQSTGLNLAQPL